MSSGSSMLAKTRKFPPQPGLLLEARMRVIPVSAVLVHLASSCSQRAEDTNLSCGVVDRCAELHRFWPQRAHQRAARVESRAE